MEEQISVLQGEGGQLDAAKGGRGFSASTLKTIAIAAMAIDHTAHTFFPDITTNPLGMIMRCIGRITGPVMFYFLVEGYHHTRNKNRYLGRMALFAAISYFPFLYFMEGSLWPGGTGFLSLNVIYTLTLALCALRARHEVKKPVLRWGIIVLAFALSTFGDWGYLCILIVLLFDVFRGNFKHQAVAYCTVVFMQVWQMVASVIQMLVYGMNAEYIPMYLASVVVQAGMFLPIVLLSFYNGQRGSGNKWLFYIFYPAHLLLIAVIRDALAGAFG